METGYTVMDLMTTNPVKVGADTSIQEVARMMSEKDVGSVLIMDKEKFIGLATEKDFLTKAIAKNLDTTKEKISEIMTPLNEIVKISPEKDVFDAIKLMKETDVRRLPVMDKKVLKGIITQKDILKIEPTLFDIIVEKIRIKEEERKLPADEELEED